MSAPASAARSICASVAATSGVGVFVMVCTLIGASPPTRTEPTAIWRDLRRQGRIGLCVMNGIPEPVLRPMWPQNAAR